MLTGELLAKVKKIEIQTRKLVDEITGGAYHSVFKGHGIEFSEVREYTADDDVRDIDWNVTARMGSPYIKKYAEERELNVMIVTDASASGLYGSSELEKRDKITEVAALLALSAIRNNDKVGLQIFTDRTELYLPPRSGRIHGLRVIRELVAMHPQGKRTDIHTALEDLLHTLKKRSVIFFISDFLDGGDYEKTLKILARKHDVIACRILDETELDLPFSIAGLNVEGLEDGRTLEFNGSCEQYHQAAQSGHDQTCEICRQAKVDIIDLRCNDDPVLPLMKFFRNRRNKR